jgi:hypothetical protein
MIKRDSFVVFFPLEYNYSKVADLLFGGEEDYSENKLQMLLSPSPDVYDNLLNLHASDLVVFTHGSKMKVVQGVMHENPETIMWLRICERLGLDFIEEDNIADLKEEIKGRYEAWNQK